MYMYVCKPKTKAHDALLIIAMCIIHFHKNIA